MVGRESLWVVFRPDVLSPIVASADIVRFLGREGGYQVWFGGLGGYMI